MAAGDGAAGGWTFPHLSVDLFVSVLTDSSFLLVVDGLENLDVAPKQEGWNRVVERGEMEHWFCADHRRGSVLGLGRGGS